MTRFAPRSVVHARGVGALLVLTVVTAVGTTPSAASVSHQRGSTIDRSMIWVASASAQAVTAYPVSSTGKVHPAEAVGPVRDPSAVWDPWGVAIGPKGTVLVQSFLSDATTFAFAPTSTGSLVLQRTFRIDGPDTRALTVEPDGTAIIATGEGPAELESTSATAAGQATSLYAVSSLHQTHTDEAVWHPWPSVLATGPTGVIAMAVVRRSGNALETWPENLTGAPTVVSGLGTQLGRCALSCTQLVVAAASSTKSWLVGVSGGGQTKVVRVPFGTHGNVAPNCVLAGPKTQLGNELITGLASSPATGDTYVLAKSAEFSGAGEVLRFGPAACGDVAPLSTFTDAATGFSSAMGIAVSS